VLSSEPSITTHALDPSDRFAIFASDGLWDHMKPAEACSIVARFPRAVSPPALSPQACCCVEAQHHLLPETSSGRCSDDFACACKVACTPCCCIRQGLGSRPDSSLEACCLLLALLRALLCPLQSIARRLVKVALDKACRIHDLKLSQLPRVDPAQRRLVHDDITVIVLFFDHDEHAWAKLPSAHTHNSRLQMVSEADPGGRDRRGGQGQGGAPANGGPAEAAHLSIKGLGEFTPRQPGKPAAEGHGGGEHDAQLAPVGRAGMPAGYSLPVIPCTDCSIQVTVICCTHQR